MGLFDFVYKIAKIAEIAEPIINFITDDGETDSNFSISSEDVSELIGECDSFFNTISKLSLDEENDIIMCLDHIDRRIIKIDSISTISYDDCISNELTRIQDIMLLETAEDVELFNGMNMRSSMIYDSAVRHILDEKTDLVQILYNYYGKAIIIFAVPEIAEPIIENEYHLAQSKEKIV